MDRNGSRSRVLKVITNSPWIALVVGVIVIVFYTYAGANPLNCIAMFLLGAALSPLIAKQYKTEKLRYALLYGALLGIGSAVLGRNESSATNLIASSVYTGMCVLFGTSVMFAVFKNRLLRYLSPADVQTS